MSYGNGATSVRRRWFSVARHNEQRCTVELVNRPQALRVVVLRHVHDLLLRRHARQGHGVVEPLMYAHEPAVLFFYHELERHVAERHRHNRVERVGIARTDEIAEPLVDDVDLPTLVELRRRLPERVTDLVADPAELAVPEHVGLFALEAHPFVRGEPRAFRNEDDRIAAR